MHEKHTFMKHIFVNHLLKYLIHPTNRVSGDLLLVSSRTIVVSDRHHMYNKTVYGLIDKHLLISPTSIGCVLTVAGSSYVRKRETIYYGEAYFLSHTHTHKLFCISSEVNNWLRCEFHRGISSLKSSMLSIIIAIPFWKKKLTFHVTLQ